MSESWRWIEGYEGVYEVSSAGRVRSFAKYPDGRFLRPGRMNRFGHLSVMLGRDGGSKTVHSLVMSAFSGPRPKGADVAHLNGVGSDNRLHNLKYTSRSENNLHVAVHDRRKISRAKVAFIKRSTYTGTHLSRFLGVSASQISNIRNGRQRANG